MLQSWRRLLFMHCTADPELVQGHLPTGLTVDTYPDSEGRERAWIGLVPFTMCEIRPRSLPSAPWISSFHETNVRTYVHLQGKEPGVWFFSLEAARWLACSFARARFALPYYHAFMRLDCLDPKRVSYASRRRGADARLDLEYAIGDAMAEPAPGSLEFWLVERYLLYSQRNGRLFTGRVFHPPYPLTHATVLRCDSNLIEAAGLPAGPWEHVCYSPGVDVEVFRLGPV